MGVGTPHAVLEAKTDPEAENRWDPMEKAETRPVTFGTNIGPRRSTSRMELL
jgi:hypothetical protein